MTFTLGIMKVAAKGDARLLAAVPSRLLRLWESLFGSAFLPDAPTWHTRSDGEIKVPQQ